MSWTFRDKRQDPDAPSDADIQAAETDRQRKRLDLRREIARLSLLKERAGHLQDEIQRIDSEAEQAADAHSAACVPLQQELAALEERAINRIAKREPGNADEDGRRGEIIGEIQAHNEALEVVVSRAKKLKQPLEGQQYRLSMDAAPLDAVRGRLSNIGYADPALLIESHCQQQRSKFAGARLAAAHQALKIVRYNCQEIQRGRMHGDLAAQRFRADRWAAEVQAAGQEQADAMAAGSSIHAAMIAE